MSTPASPEQPPRSSKFIEGSALTRPDLVRHPTVLNNILTEMDEHERQRKHRNSSASVESLDSPIPAPVMGRPEKRRSFGTRRSLGDVDRSHLKDVEDTPKREENLVGKVKGRLRALTVGRREEKSPNYAGT